MKLALGTVQFGLNYGAFNRGGQPAPEEVRAILACARDAGITLLDTARAYGTSEEVIAQAGGPDDFRIVTKCPAVPESGDPAASVLAAFEASCEALGVTGVYGYLLHRSDDLARPGVWEVLAGLVREGRAARVGVSGYDADEVNALCARYPITLAQLPANVLDPWFRHTRLPETVEVHVRSAFLQGFLLSDPACLPPRFQPWQEPLMTFREGAAAAGLSPLEAALAPLLTCGQIAQVVVGVDGRAHLQEIVEAASVACRREDFQPPPIPGVTRNLTDPRRWT